MGHADTHLVHGLFALEEVFIAQRNNGALRIRHMGAPLLYRLICARFWHLYPLTAHFCLELHLDCSFVQKMSTLHENQDHQSHTSAQKDERALKVEFAIGSDKLDWQKPSEVSR